MKTCIFVVLVLTLSHLFDNDINLLNLLFLFPAVANLALEAAVESVELLKGLRLGHGRGNFRSLLVHA